MTAREVITTLKGVKRSGNGWTARCPTHDDKHNSLSISDGEDGRLLLCCHAGCSFESILASIPQSANQTRREVATYDYLDALKKIAFQAVRYEPKDFRLRRPDGNGGWTWNLNGSPRYLYRYPELLEARSDRTIFIVEGEKDADALVALGLVATCNPCGAGKWRNEFNEALRDRIVVVLPDNDEPGRKHAEQIAGSLSGIASSVKVVELPGLQEKGDVSDWINAGGSLSELRRLVTSAAVYSKPLTRNGFVFTALEALMAEPKELIAYVVFNLLACSCFSILAAKPKVGKSTFARALAVAVAMGQEFFGRAVKQGVVIYLCLEEKRSEVAEHFRRMGASGNNIIIHTGATPQNALTALEAAIEEYSPVLIIIDPLSRFVRVTDFNSYAETTRALEPLIDLARLSACGTHILALHHNGKGGDLREAGDAVMGSTGFFGAVDALLTMRKRERSRTIESTQRYGEDLPETIVHLNPVTGLVESAGDMAEFELSERKKAIMEVICEEPLTESAIKELVSGSNRGLTSKGVRSLFDEGKLFRSGAGKKGDPFVYRKVAHSKSVEEFEFELEVEGAYA